VHATLVRADQCVADDIPGVVVEANVVEGELERLARAVDERRDPPRDIKRRLAAVGEGVNVDQDCRSGCMGVEGYVQVLEPPVGKIGAGSVVLVLSAPFSGGRSMGGSVLEWQKDRRAQLYLRTVRAVMAALPAG
jgi:hypothetical protein